MVVISNPVTLPSPAGRRALAMRSTLGSRSANGRDRALEIVDETHEFWRRMRAETVA